MPTTLRRGDVLLVVLSRGAALLVVLLVVLRLDVLLGILSGWAHYRDAGLLVVLDYNAGLLVAICFYSPVAGLRWRVRSSRCVSS